MLERQIKLARAIAGLLLETPGYELLPKPRSHDTATKERLREIYIIVVFRATDQSINTNLVQRINSSRRIYVSGTQWDGKPAARFAVANWQVDVERDLTLIKEVLLEALK